MPKELLRAPYGSWKSPITSDLIVASSVSLSEVLVEGGEIYWLEGRPEEAGRSVVVRRRVSEEKGTDLNPAPFNVRTRVHEYGGGAWTISDGTLFFSNDEPKADDAPPDRRLYRLGPNDATPVPFTDPGPWRYTDGLIDTGRNRWIGICEDHTIEPSTNSIVAVDLKASGVGSREPLLEGHDFYSTPRLSSDGKWLAWITWNLPSMPWNGTKLAIAEIGADGKPLSEVVIAGGDTESVLQPEWLPDGKGLVFISDRSGWWNLYYYDLNAKQAAPLWQTDAEFGQPQWRFGMSSYAFSGRDRIICSLICNGLAQLAELDLATGKNRAITTPYTEIGFVRATADRVVFRGGASNLPTSIVALDLDSGRIDVIVSATKILDDPELRSYLATGRAIEFKTAGERMAHGFYYPPHNPTFGPLEQEKPPLLVRCHGGPTAAASPALDLRIHYWTSRGVAFLDVNYGGSTGFGRAYRDVLHLAWGEVDVDDAEAGARHLADEGLVDPTRMVISGGSAGGYTTLAALAFRRTFAGGASYYGVSDPAKLAQDTHKFESKYLDWLIAPYPEGEDVYSERSPLGHADHVRAPVIFFQGDEDKVVPPDQTDRMVAALRERDIPAGYLIFSGEQHGFRKAENIKRALDAELYFFAMNVFKTTLIF